MHARVAEAHVHLQRRRAQRPAFVHCAPSPRPAASSLAATAGLSPAWAVCVHAQRTGADRCLGRNWQRAAKLRAAIIVPSLLHPSRPLRALCAGLSPAVPASGNLAAGHCGPPASQGRSYAIVRARSLSGPRANASASSRPARRTRTMTSRLCHAYRRPVAPGFLFVFPESPPMHFPCFTSTARWC